MKGMSSASLQRTRILLLDSSRVVIESLKAFLADRVGLQVVGEAINGYEGLRKVALLRPRLIVTEYHLPLLNGPLVACQAKHIDPGVKIITYTEESYRYYLPDILRCPTGHILKNRLGEDLVKTIGIVKDGGAFFAEDVVHLWNEYMTNRGSRLDPFEQLTVREKEVFQLLAEGRSVKKAAGYLCVSPKTVDTYKHHIMEKLGMKSTSEWTREAIRRGILKVHPGSKVPIQ
jgi:two-component system response regulator NreC